MLFDYNLVYILPLEYSSIIKILIELVLINANYRLSLLFFIFYFLLVLYSFS